MKFSEDSLAELQRQQVSLLSWVSPEFHWQEKGTKNTKNQIRDELVL